MLNASRVRAIRYIKQHSTPITNQTLCRHSHTSVKLYTSNKVSFITKKSPNDEQTMNEIRIYQIINDLVYSGKSPFFFVSVKPPKINGGMVTQYIETSNRNVGLLWDFLKKPRSEKIRKSLTFQILHAIGWLNKTGIQHGDLHFDNIFVVKSKHAYLDLYTPGAKHRVPTYGYEIRIFDFDRSFKKKTSRYPLTIKSHKTHSKFDYFKFMVYAQYPAIHSKKVYRLWSLLPPHTITHTSEGYILNIDGKQVYHPYGHPPRGLRIRGTPFQTIRRWYRI